MTPSEAHRLLVEMEREKDKRRPILVGPASVVTPDTIHGDRKCHRCTVALTARDKLRLLQATGAGDVSEWIRTAILERLERLTAENDVTPTQTTGLTPDQEAT